MGSTLLELPPEQAEDSESSGVDYVRARSLEDFALQTHIEDQGVLDRVLLPGQRFGDYEILGFIASGGMGEVYAAKRRGGDGRPRRPVALKIISASLTEDWRIIERFKREAQISRAIDAPNVIRVYEYGETERGDAFLSMELLAGEELFERLIREHTLPLDELAELAIEVLDGLHDVHRSGFIHRDIKPENIFLARQRGGGKVAKILDFGIAKRSEAASDPLLSVVGQIYGTPQYMAPEQAVDPNVDHRADIYSMGVVLFEAASGSLPFEGESAYETIVKHQVDPVPALPSSIDPGFAEIVHTALAKDPRERFQSADEMRAVLQTWLDETSWVEALPGAGRGFEERLAEAPESPGRKPTRARRRRQAITTNNHASLPDTQPPTPAPPLRGAPAQRPPTQVQVRDPADRDLTALTRDSERRAHESSTLASIITWAAAAAIAAAVVYAWWMSTGAT